MNNTFKPPGTKALRKGRYSCPRHIYFITTVCIVRSKLFLDTYNARLVSMLCHDERIWGNSRLLAWVLMPDHWHGILELGENTTLSSTVQAFKSRSAKAINLQMNTSGKVWQSGFHDRCLSQAALLTAARYLITNPLRAGLVNEIGQYPYWDAVWLEDWKSIL